MNESNPFYVKRSKVGRGFPRHNNPLAMSEGHPLPREAFQSVVNFLLRV